MAKKATKNVATKATAKERFNLREMNQTHGAVASPSINQYLTGYETANAEDYAAKLEKMESTELYDHAVAVGEVPIDDRVRLIDRLQTRFSQVQAASIPRQNIPIEMSKENEEKLRKIMLGAR